MKTLEEVGVTPTASIAAAVAAAAAAGVVAAVAAAAEVAAAAAAAAAITAVVTPAVAAAVAAAAAAVAERIGSTSHGGRVRLAVKAVSLQGRRTPGRAPRRALGDRAVAHRRAQTTHARKRAERRVLELRMRRPRPSQLPPPKGLTSRRPSKSSRARSKSLWLCRTLTRSARARALHLTCCLP